MIEITDFDREVLEQSRSKPVLVDFWAPWCGPCRQLGPILEHLEATQGDSFILAKLNTDENPAVSASFGIRSIPAVKLFVDGQVQDEFIGALPETQVKSWLANALPSETRRLVQQAQALIESEQPFEAESLLSQVLEAEPGNSEAALLLAKLILFHDAGRARNLAEEAMRAGVPQYELGKAIVLIAAQLGEKSQVDLLEAPAKLPYVEGIEALHRHALDAALDAFVRSVAADRRYADEAARRTCLAMFTLLGREDPLTRTYQRRLQSALF